MELSLLEFISLIKMTYTFEEGASMKLYKINDADFYRTYITIDNNMLEFYKE